MSFILFCLLATLVPERFVICYLGMFSSPVYCYLANRLYFITLFIRRVSPLPSLNQVYCCYYLLQKLSLCPGVVT